MASDITPLPSIRAKIRNYAAQRDQTDSSHNARCDTYFFKWGYTGKGAVSLDRRSRGVAIFDLTNWYSAGVLDIVGTAEVMVVVAVQRVARGV